MGILRTGRFAFLGAAAGAALLLATAPVSAQGVGGGVVVGSGTITPGLTASFTPQAVSFTGNLVGAGFAGGPQTYVLTPCSFNGGSGATTLGVNNPEGGDNVAFGMGEVSGTCGNISATVTYIRIGAAVVLVGNGSVNGVAGDVVGACLFATTQQPPITAYTVVCASVAAGA
jgi:hypothetical protein